jgi:hypothetical protein
MQSCVSFNIIFIFLFFCFLRLDRRNCRALASRKARDAYAGGVVLIKRRNGWLASELIHSKELSFMPTQKHGLIIETPTEARQAEPGPSILMVLVISTILAVLVLGGVSSSFFRI